MGWLVGALRELHGAVETETVDDSLRSRTAGALGQIEAAKREVLRALEKMGITHGADGVSLELSAIAEETKADVLKLNADYIEALLGSERARRGHGDLLALMQGAADTLRSKSSEIREKLGRSLRGPEKRP